MPAQKSVLEKQFEIFLSRDSRSLEVVQDDKNLNRAIHWDDDGTPHTLFYVDKMVAFLPV